MTRAALIHKFIESSAWAGATTVPLAGDASNRRYLRVTHPDLGRAVLMDAPPEKGEDTKPFIEIAQHLSKIDLSAPTIFTADITNGFLLIEDLGDELFDRVVEKDPTLEEQLYRCAWSGLLQIWQNPVPTGIPPYDPSDMAERSKLVAEWYDTSQDAAAIHASVFKALKRLDWAKPTLALRDFHAQNLLWLPDRSGAARVGLLDFQDAQPGHILYDLISLLFDARRDVSDKTRAALLDQAQKDTGLADFEDAVAALLAQRSLRILGVFARLSLRDGKPSYVDLIPRVFAQLEIALGHPSLTDLRSVLAGLAAPDETHLSTLRVKT